jgi:hypothetical protein
MKVQSTAIQVKPLEILGNRVFIRKNIIKVEKTVEEATFAGWEYDETKLTIDEYLSSFEIMGQQLTSILLEA